MEYVWSDIKCQNISYNTNNEFIKEFYKWSNTLREPLYTDKKSIYKISDER